MRKLKLALVLGAVLIVTAVGSVKHIDGDPFPPTDPCPAGTICNP